MKTKRFSKLLIGAGLCFTLGLAPLTSCSTFFGDDGFVITDVTWKPTGEGHIIVTIQTTNDENPTMIFTIPEGLPGVDGVGIKDIKTSTNEDNSEVTLTIIYTDDKLDPTVITVPIVHGKDGKGIKEVKVENNENGDLVIIFEYTDGTSSDPLLIPRGENGNGIKDIAIDDISDPDNIILTISFSDPSFEDKKILLPKGKDGIGISSITVDDSKSTPTEYVLIIEYSDGFTEELVLPKPLATVWHHGETIPNSSLGKEGDYYLNVISGFVYVKENGTWNFIFSMDGSGSAVEHTVKFHSGEGTWVDPQLKDGVDFILTIRHGEYISLSQFPTIELTGHKFIGWFTGDETEVNAGQFTDLTPVQRNMELYPRWIIE